MAFNVCIRVSLIAATAVVLNPTKALSYLYPGETQCPWNNPGNSWQGFLLGEYGKGNGQHYFSIKFVKDVGSIAAGRCYTVSYLGNSSWGAAGWNRIRKMNDAEEGKPRVGGSPQDMKINVWGAQFIFNEGGEVSLNDQVVGHLYCHIGPECDKG